MKTRLCRAFAVGVMTLAAAWATPGQAADWGTVATISSTLGVSANRLCLGEGLRVGDIGCPTYAPYVTLAGKVGVGTDAPTAMLQVSGTFTVSNSAQTTTPTIYTSSTGFVGLGTNNPQARLHLHQTGGGFANIQLTNDDTGQADNTTGLRLGLSSVETGLLMGGKNTGGIGLGTSETVRLFINNSGSTIISLNGTATSGASLTVVGEVQVSNSGAVCVANNNGGAIRYTSGTGLQYCNGNSAWTSLSSNTTAGLTGAGSATAVAFWDGPNSLSYDSGLYWDNVSKRLGIGVTTPGQSLTVVGQAGISSTATEGLQLRTGPDQWNSIAFYSNTTRRGAIGADSKNNLTMYSDGDMRFFTNSSLPRMVILSATNGFIGIGTVTPTANLQISGTFTVSNSNQTTTPSLYVASNGNVGISTSNPVAALQVAGIVKIGSTATAVPTEGNPQLVVGSGGNGLAIGWNYSGGSGETDFYNYGQAAVGGYRFYNTPMPGGGYNSGPSATIMMSMLGSNGFVGISTVTPNAKLDVYGSISASNVYVTGTTGTVSATYGYFKYISATTLYGDGSNLTGITADATDRIVSGTGGTTSMVAISNTGYISITQGAAATNTGWFDPTTGYVGLGVSTTGAVSGTTGYFNRLNVGISSWPELLNVFGNVRLLANTSTGLFGYSGASNFVFSLTREDTNVAGSLAVNALGNIGFAPGVSSPNSTNYTMIVRSTGKVGIGTITPTATLQVSGSFTVSQSGQTTTPSINVRSDGKVTVGLSTGSPVETFTVGGDTAPALAVVANTGAVAQSATLRLIGSNSIGTSSQEAKLVTYQPGGASAGDTALDLRVRKNADVFGAPSTIMTLFGNGNVGIGTITPTAILQVSGTFIVSTSAAATSPSLFVTSAGLVGIGTSVPRGVLEVASDTVATIRLHTQDGTQGATSQLIFENRFGTPSNAKTGIIAEGIGGSWGLSKLHFAVDGNSDNSIVDKSDALMTLDWTGRVGIGTQSPTAKFEVVGNISATAINVTGTTPATGTISGTYGYFKYLSATTLYGDGSNLTGITADATDRIVSGSTNQTSMVAVSASGLISVTQNGGNTAWFDPVKGLVTIGVSSTGPISGTAGYFNGNVGIGSTPQGAGTPLKVAIDNSRSFIISTASGFTNAAVWDLTAGGLYIGLSRPQDGLIASGLFTYEGTSNNMAISARGDLVLLAGTGGIAANTERARIRSSGSFGIGTSSPTATLQVSGTFTVSNSNQTTTPSIFVASNGNVGIGGASPNATAKLQVDGPGVFGGAAGGGFPTEGNPVLLVGQFGKGLAIGWNYNSGGGAGATDFYAYGQGGSGGYKFWNVPNPGASYANAPSATIIMTLGGNGNVGISTTNPTAKLEVLGNISATGINVTGTTPATGTISGTYGYFKYLSATTLYGDGSNLTGITADATDRIVSGSTNQTSMVAISATGLISVTQNGGNTAWFDPVKGLVTIGVSSTGGISGTTGSFYGNVRVSADSGAGLYGWSSLNSNVFSLTRQGSANPLTVLSANSPLGFAANTAVPTTAFTLLVNNGTVGVGLGTVTATAATLQVSGTFLVSNTNQVTTPSIYINSSGNTGMGTDSPAQKLDVNGIIRSAGVEGLSSGGLQIPEISNPTFQVITDNQLPSLTAIINGWGSATNPGVTVGTVMTSGVAFRVVTGATINATTRLAQAFPTTAFYVGGNSLVGIGTVSPNAGLDVAGNISASNVYVTGTTGTVSATYGYFKYISASSIDGALTGTGSATAVAFWNGPGSLTYDSGLYWNNTSKALGIGTTTPGAALQISKSTSDGISIIANGESRISFARPDLQAWTIGHDSVNGRFVISQNPTSLQTPRMVVTNAGNVGVGYSTPTATLQVSGTFTVSNSSQVTTPSIYVHSNGAVGIGMNSPNHMLDISGSGGLQVVAGGSGSNIATFVRGDTGLTTGFGMLSPGNVPSMYISNSTNVWAMGAAGNSLLLGSGVNNVYAMTAAPQLTLNTNGNVGVGLANSATTPNAKLEVNGTISASNVFATAPTGTVSATYGYFKYISASSIDGAVTGTGSATAVAFWNGPSSLGYDAGLYWDNSGKELGIGTTTPDAPLAFATATGDKVHLYGNTFGIGIESNTLTQWAPWFRWRSGGTSVSTGSEVMFLSATGLKVSGTFIISNTNQTTTPSIYVGSNGNVGIGTNAPFAKFDIAVSSSTPVDLMHWRNEYLGSDLFLREGASGSFSFNTELAGSGTNIMTFYGAVGRVGIGYSTPTAALQVSGTFTVSNSSQTTTPSIYVGSNGNVGIGTAAPTSALSVSSTMSFTGTASNSIAFPAVGIAAPAAGSAGMKVQLYGTTANVLTITDYAIGIENAHIWTNAGNILGGHKWYITGANYMTLTSNSLSVSASIVSKAFNNNAGTTIDWSQGNNQYTTANCQAMTFSNMQDGGVYTLFVKGTTTGTCSFTHSGVAFLMPTDHGATTSGTKTLYTFMREGTDVVVTWIPGY